MLIKQTTVFKTKNKFSNLQGTGGRSTASKASVDYCNQFQKWGLLSPSSVDQ